MNGPGPLFTVGLRGLRVAVRLTPRARRNAVTGCGADVDGTPLLRAVVTAVPERGAANAALIALLARSWRLPRTSLAVVGGATDRNKLIEIAGGDELLAERLKGWAAALGDQAG